MPVEAYTVGHRSHVCYVKEYWSTQRSLHQILGFLDFRRTSFSGVGASRNVDQGGSLLPLNKVDDCHKIEEEPKTGVTYSLAVAGSADALALPNGTQHIDRAVSGQQIGEESWAALVHVLRQAVIQIPRLLRLGTGLEIDFEFCEELQLPRVCSRHPCPRLYSIESCGRQSGQNVAPPIQCLQTVPIHGDRLEWTVAQAGMRLC